MRKYTPILLLLASLLAKPVQAAIGDWAIYMAYHDACKTAPAGHLVYVLSNNSLYSYDQDDTSLQTYDKTNLLNDVSIKDIAYAESLRTLVIVYDNSNIDLLVDDKETVNIPDLMNKSMYEDKTVNHIRVQGDYAYLSTNFGLVVVNVKKQEIANSYILGKKANACVLHDQAFYLATDEGVFQGKTTDNLLDKKNWTLYKENVFADLLYFDHRLVGITSDGGVYIPNYETQDFDLFYVFAHRYVAQTEDKLILGEVDKAHIFDSFAQHITVSTEWTDYMTYHDGIYWAGNDEYGLNGYRLNEADATLTNTTGHLLPDSPLYNWDYSMTFTDRLLIAGGGIWADRYFRPATIMEYKDNTWSHYDESVSNLTGEVYYDINKVAVDPRDSEHIFASSSGEGVYEYQNGKFVKLYRCDNSTLESIFPGQSGQNNFIRTSGVAFDAHNNLWVNCAQVEHTLHVMQPDGQWRSFSHSNFSQIATPGDIVFDQRGWLWTCSKRGTNAVGVFCFNANNTLDNTADDQTVYWQTFVDQNGEKIVPIFVYTVVEDLDGTIWAGTDKGPLVFTNPSRIFESNTCTRIIVPRNDGTNLGDYLLEHESIKVIAIDGDNRKWIGTEGSGIYLISADGMQTIHHFTTENSPLISDNIESVAIDPTTGEVWIGTDKGLVSYRSDATSGTDRFVDEQVYAYPNPVPSYYDGQIAIVGLMRDSQVKIVDASGRLVHSGVSKGGQFTWNGCDASGRRVASGIYLVLATNESGKEGVATKIAVIR